MEELRAEKIFIPFSDDPSKRLEAYFCANPASVFPERKSFHPFDIIVTHPHPKFGGSLFDHTTFKLFSFFCTQINCRSVICFNFRGVGNSSGSSSWKGRDERKDILSVVDFLLNHQKEQSAPATKILVCGYSFGSVVGSSVAAQELHSRDLISGYIAVSYPCGWISSWLFSTSYKDVIQQAKDNPRGALLPKLFVIGDQDEFASTDQLQNFLHNVPAPVSLTIIQGASHFYLNSSFQIKLCEAIEEWLASLLPSAADL